MVKIQLNPEHFTGANATHYQLFESALYDGFCYCEKFHFNEFHFSEKFKIRLGYEATSALELGDIFTFDDIAIFLDMLSVSDENAEIAKTKDLKVLTKSGAFVWMQCQVYSAPSSDENLHLLFAGFRDIQRSKVSEINEIIRCQRTDEILNAASVGTWQYHLKTGEKIWSNHLSKIIGYTVLEIEDPKSDFWLAFSSKGEGAKLQQLFDDHIDNKLLDVRYEIRLKHKFGHYIWIIIVGKVISFSQEQEAEWLGGIVYDITQRKNREENSLKYEDLIPQVNKAAQIGIWEVDLATNEVYFSDELKKIYGIPLSFEPSYEYSIEFINEGENRQKMIDAVSGAIERGINYDIEVEATNRKGENVWIRARGFSEFIADKCTRFYGFLQDITERKIANRELALKDELFKKTFFYAPFGMAITDLEGKISQSNSDLCTIFGYNKLEMIGRRLREFSFPEDKNVTNGLIASLLNRKCESFKVDKRYIHKSGSIIWAQVSVSAIKNEVGKITNFVAQIQDISERKRDELLLINYKALLERSNYVAKIGSWEIDVEDGTVSWSASLRSIINTREDSAPTFENSVEHLIADEDKELINHTIKNALALGKNFDIQVRVKDFHGVYKWVRMVGISEYYDGKCQRLYGLIQDINDLKQAQHDSAVKEELWRTTFNYANAGIALINFDGQPYKVNQSICEIFGYTIQEMQNVRIKDLSLPEDLQDNIIRMKELISGTTTHFNTEMRFFHKDKHIIWTNVTVSAVRNDYDHFTHMVAQVIDITKSKTNELLLKKYKEILDRSNEVAKIGSWEYNPRTLLLLLSKNLHSLLGTNENGTSSGCGLLNDFIFEDDQKRINKLIGEALKEGNNFDIELELKTSSGLRWMRIIAISNFENGSCNLLHGLVQDIHEIKLAQMEIQLREQEFRQSFWYASTGMALVDLEGRIVRANPSLCETLGYTMQELIEIDKVFLSNSDDAEITTLLIEELASGKRDSFEQEKRYYHKNKNIIWAILSMSAVKSDKGETTHYVVLVTDITDKKMLTESLKEHNNRLQNYAHIVSHNLRSHTGNLMMLLELSEIDNEQKINQELFEHMKSAATNMSETVSHLSEIVEIQNLIKNTLVAQNLQKRVKRALENVQATISQINGKIIISVSEDLMVYAIPSYLDSILLNILTNAIKYRSNERPLIIKIVAERINGRTNLNFIDNGLGIDLEKCGSKIFGMYKTFHEHKDARGIGLFMTKNQLEAMDGGITVQSKPDVGSTFTIYFKNENN